MTDEMNETTETTDSAEPTDAIESPSVSTGTAASANSTTGVASASHEPPAQPDASKASQQQGVASASYEPPAQPDASASEPADTDSEPSGAARARRKLRDGVVVASAMDKTIVVAVVERVRHQKYNKFVLQTKRLYAHDESNDVNVGDRVRVMETRPMSKTKRWRVTDVLERAK